ncbi:MAG: hypothetical protein K2K45_06285 [Muribaculaceae bacterium]|nr:hypothetical protein [Muribaculaceae bacterium]
MDYFKEQNKFVTDMVNAYNIGKLCSEFAPYIQWKTGNYLFSKEQAFGMLNTASSLLDKMFDDANADEELRSYLEGIDYEVTNILPLLK